MAVKHLRPQVLESRLAIGICGRLGAEVTSNFSKQDLLTTTRNRPFWYAFESHRCITFLHIYIFVTGCDSRHYLGCYEEDGEWLGDCNVPESGDPTSWNRPYYQFAWNLCGLICIIAWVTITVGPLMGLFNYFGILRYNFYREPLACIFKDTPLEMKLSF